MECPLLLSSASHWREVTPRRRMLMTDDRVGNVTRLTAFLLWNVSRFFRWFFFCKMNCLHQFLISDRIGTWTSSAYKIRFRWSVTQSSSHPVIRSSSHPSSHVFLHGVSNFARSCNSCTLRVTF